MRLFFLCAVGLFLVLASRRVQATDWSIDVVPQNSISGKQFINIHDPFYVVLTNTTDHDLNVWKEWCSWGYFNLSFEFTAKNGTVFHVKKRKIDFTKNSPAQFVVKRQKHFVIAVTLNAQGWLGTESLDGPISLKAIYENTNADFPGEKSKSSGDAKRDALISSGWVGRIESDPIQVTVVR